jgi:hypothetical protein
VEKNFKDLSEQEILALAMWLPRLDSNQE